MPIASLTQVGRQSWTLGGLVAATALSVVLSLNAWAADEPRDAPHCPPAAMHGGPEMMPFSGKGLDRMLSHVDATAAQKDQIRKIADAAEPELKALHEQGRALHEEGVKLWSAPKLDTAAIEQLRQKESAQHDLASKRMVKLMLDVGQVLTPEQRAKLAQHMEAHRPGSRPDHGDRPAQRDN